MAGAEAGEYGPPAQVLASGMIWRSWGIWRWKAWTRTLDDAPLDKGNGWNLTKRGAEYDGNIWLHHHGATALWDPDHPGSRDGSDV